jgi:glycosyltransferase involved in cell wall biosynthesis
MTLRDKPVLFVLKGYPRLSETFIAQEILTLEKRGMDIRILALRQPTDDRVHPVHRDIQAPVHYLPEYLHNAPLRVLKGMFACLRRPRFGRAMRALLKDVRRDPTRNRLRRFGQAAVLVAEHGDEVSRLHAHFMHTPASVVRYASLMTGLPWSCSAHAKDIWTSQDWDLTEKLAEADWTVTCTRMGATHLAALAPDSARVHLVYHGLDLARFPALPLPRPARDGKDATKPVEILTVARVVEKKGLDLLLGALAQLPEALHWRWTHVGGGQTQALKAQAETLGLDTRCRFLGARDQSEVLALYRTSDLFVLPCRVADDGDRDGLPNVLVEASSQGLAVLSTTIAGVPELIEDGINGRLCEAESVPALVAALTELMIDPEKRWRLGKAAMARVKTSFDHQSTIDALEALFQGRPIPPESLPEARQ